MFIYVVVFTYFGSIMHDGAIILRHSSGVYIGCSVTRSLFTYLWSIMHDGAIIIRHFSGVYICCSVYLPWVHNA